jgi:predicted RNA polymerase sigma factor
MRLYRASRAEQLLEQGQCDLARDADGRALELTADPAGQAVLQRRLDRGPAYGAGER